VFKWSGVPATTYSDLTGLWSGKLSQGKGSLPGDVNYRLSPMSEYHGCFEIRDASGAVQPGPVVGNAIETSHNIVNAYLVIGTNECSLTGKYSPTKRQISLKGKDTDGQPVSIVISQ